MPSTRAAWAGRALVYLVALVLLADGIAQLMLPPFMVPVLTASQLPLILAPVLGTITIACAIVLAIPRLAVLGAILVTAFLGGAIATHFRLGEIGSPDQLICVLLGTATWAGLYLSDPRLRALLPLRQTAS